MNFNDLNVGEIDKDLTQKERNEWNAIYASYRAGSLLSGEIAGVDEFNNSEQKTLAAVVIPYRVKILIPEKFLWTDTNEIPSSITRNMLGAHIDFIIKEIDRENNFCIASRIDAMRIKKRKFFTNKPTIGDYVKCNILAVGREKMIIETCGFDIQFTQKDLCYSMTPDLRLKYSSGQNVPGIIKKVNNLDNELVVSVRDANPHPYDGIKKRHPIGSRRSSMITGKYKGCVFCKLEDDFDCMCNYSEFQYDEDYRIGDKIIIAISKHDNRSKRVYGVILSKWN